ncbi:hypothetical protein LINPERHAP1_LOCUS27606 [Linum perenne]
MTTSQRVHRRLCGLFKEMDVFQLNPVDKPFRIKNFWEWRRFLMT